MATEWKSQQGDDKYAIQFETTRHDLYKLVEKACQKAVDKANKDRDKERASTMRAETMTVAEAMDKFSDEG